MRLEPHRKSRVRRLAETPSELRLERFLELGELRVGERLSHRAEDGCELLEVRLEHRRDAGELELALTGNPTIEAANERLLQDRQVRLALVLWLEGSFLAHLRGSA
jgi:hypothetical protein